MADGQHFAHTGAAGAFILDDHHVALLITAEDGFTPPSSLLNTQAVTSRTIISSHGGLLHYGGAVGREVTTWMAMPPSLA